MPPPSSWRSGEEDDDVDASEMISSSSGVAPRRVLTANGSRRGIRNDYWTLSTNGRPRIELM